MSAVGEWGVKTGSRYSKRRKRFAVVTCKHKRGETDAKQHVKFRNWNIKCWEHLTGKSSKNTALSCKRDGCFHLVQLSPFLPSTNKPNPIIFVRFVPSRGTLIITYQRHTSSFITTVHDLHHNKYAVGTVYLTKQTRLCLTPGISICSTFL